MSLRRTMFSMASKTAHTNWNERTDFFHFTRGRFVSREAEQAAQRCVKFDVNQLCNVAGAAVGTECVDVKKYDDGMYNKVFLLTMHNKQQVVAKIPNPNAGVPHLTTASEVATMDFVRNVLSTPVPQVLAWNSSNKNSVGSEYIIMEKANGVQLSTVWPRMTGDQKVQVVRAVARQQRAWATTSFSSIGSLYYQNDIESGDAPETTWSNDSGRLNDDSKFAIGPIMGREWVDLGRAIIQCDRGPWKTTEAYRRAVLHRDIRAVRTLGIPASPLSMLCGPTLYQPNREKKLRACEASLQVLPHILPQERWASTFHVWHDDLHEENIFVDPDDPTTITAIIDWQSAYIAPLFDHTMSPGFLDYEGPVLQGTERPKPPQLSEMATAREKEDALRLYDQQILASGYKHMMKNNIKNIYDAIMYDESERSGILSASRNLFEVGEAYCLGSIAALENTPVTFSEPEQLEIKEDIEKTAASMNAMSVIKASLGSLFPEKGCVRPDQYEESKAALRRVKEQVVDDFSRSAEDRRIWEEVWPFDD